MASNAQTVAIEADGESVLSLLYVQNATGGTLTESTLTLIGVSERTAVFSDRPHRFASRIPTEDFISRWDEGEDYFAENSPNADFTCESGGEVVNYAVELSDPSFDGQNLSYAVDAVGAGVGEVVLYALWTSAAGESRVSPTPKGNADECAR